MAGTDSQPAERLPAAMPGQDRLTADEFRNVIGHFVSGVTVISTRDGEQWFGTTASAVSSLTLEPPMLLVCMNRSSSTGQAIERSKRFAVNILGEDQGPLAERFATKAPDKFAAVSGIEGQLGQPLISDALAQLECEVSNSVEAGTHVVFVAEVLTATASKGSPLAYFRGEFGRLELTHDQLVHDALRERILGLQLGSEQPFEPTVIASELGEPMAAVQHALSKLARAGLMTRTDAGAYVASGVTWTVAEDALRGCCAIELGAIRGSAGRLTPQAMEDLDRLMRVTLGHIDVGNFNDVDRSVRAYGAFHEAVVGLAGSPSLVLAFRRLSLDGIMMRTFRPHVATEADAAFGGDHRELVAALEREDHDSASTIVSRHYARFETAFRDTLRHRVPTTR
jgi:flavin reductase (DIM6/NTAB) family NADH-FMN oxidoreductase RutF/DNA-binding FadR family transcriptional regulator